MDENQIPQGYMPPMIEFQVSEKVRKYVFHPHGMPRYLLQALVNYDMPLVRENAPDKPELEQEMINELFMNTMRDIRATAWKFECAQANGTLGDIPMQPLSKKKSEWPKDIRALVDQLKEVSRIMKKNSNFIIH